MASFSHRPSHLHVCVSHLHNNINIELISNRCKHLQLLGIIFSFITHHTVEKIGKKPHGHLKARPHFGISNNKGRSISAFGFQRYTYGKKTKLHFLSAMSQIIFYGSVIFMKGFCWI